jgi:hypothetical protein
VLDLGNDIFNVLKAKNSRRSAGYRATFDKDDPTRLIAIINHTRQELTSEDEDASSPRCHRSWIDRKSATAGIGTSRKKQISEGQFATS